MVFFTFGYVSFQIVVLLVVLGVLWKKEGWYTHTNTAASILTIVGVLGTFVGIYMGLREFNISSLQDSNGLQKSIEGLLDGLKHAFFTSIVGIASALLLKGIISPLAQIPGNEDPEQETINKFVNALKKALESVEKPRERDLSSKLQTLIATIKENGETTRNVLHDMRKDFINEQRGTLKQLETLTNTVSDEHNQLRVDRKTTRDILQGTRDDLINGQSEILKQLETLTNTVADKHDLIIASQKDEATETRKTLTDMQSELTDRQDKTLEQLGTLTETVSDEHNQLRKEFETFSKNVAESITELATKELISSLTKVIDSFNTQLSTQFGDNFKQLNEAVGRTVEWQEQYRQQMDQLAKEFQIAANSIDDSRGSLENIAVSSNTIADRSASIAGSAEKLEPILHTLNAQLEAFSDLRQKATDAFPIIEERLDDLTQKFSVAVQEAISDSHEQSKKLATQYDEFQKVIAGLDDFTTKIDGVTTHTSEIVEGLQTSIDFQEQALRNSASYVTTMQENLDKQLTASISALGTELASLSGKFVEDYTPLTQSLREVLTIADGILPRQRGN